jgi:hypothetical protein
MANGPARPVVGVERLFSDSGWATRSDAPTLSTEYPRQELNLRTRFRKPLLFH